ncbi:response regulator [Flammeovirga kamogawensis]|uniref:Response regulator n=1 Tax=Flammeovirga kamogawensis TaxID=373891 RepID=A0ABX8GRN6_9BACT|nr:response regulator [Flammeovirga kamogawensis]MBB6461328.1 CheY-like chemotaxis protein [Flammeovirga kamogawensis]QWG06234.1 response regulator [Flammeovirga kamogawensis]TRX68065.1 response regulator [Flammeovirga kamogawensis]
MSNYKNVFVIDDDPTNNLICRKMIEKTNFGENVTTFLDVTEAANAWDDYKPELVFLDINMPPSTGWDFLDQLKTKGIEASNVYMLSADVTSDDRKRAAQYEQVAGIIIKPLTPVKLKEIE